MYFSLEREFFGSCSQIQSDVDWRDMRRSAVEIIRVALVDRSGGVDVADKEIEQEWGQYAALRDAHLDFPPFGHFPLKENSDPPISQVGDKPPFEVQVEGRGINLLEEAVVVNHVESLTKVNAQKTSAVSRLCRIEAPGDVGGQRQKC